MSHTPVAFWRNTDLRKVLIGETISDLGSEIGDLALPLLAATALNATANQMATLLGAEYVPRVIVGLAAARAHRHQHGKVRHPQRSRAGGVAAGAKCRGAVRGGNC